jgi:AcrR family transcriptional regulator
MRYSPTHKQETRDKLLDSSRAIAKKGGFGATGVDALMASIGLTGGAFYSHFPSKSELFAALVEREMAHSAEMLGGSADSPADPVAKALRSYLSTAHAMHPESGCVLPTLGPEIARAGPQVRAAVERSLKKLQRSWADRLGGDGDTAWALLAQCIGAIVMARVVESDRTRQEILASSRRSVEKTRGAIRVDPVPQRSFANDRSAKTRRTKP